MKKLHILCALVLAVSLLMTGCGGKKNEETESVPSHQLYLDVDFEGNILLDKYDLVLMVDDERIDTLPHGEYYTKLLELEEGDHEIKFQKDGDDSVDVSETITLKEDSTFECSVKTHSDSIDLEKDFFSGIEGSAIEVPNVVDMVLTDALSSFEDAGFINVNYSDDVWDTDNWTVTVQDAEAGTTADKNAKITLTVVKTEELNENTETETSQEETTQAESTEEETEIVETTEAETTVAETKKAEPKVLTVKNCKDLKKLLKTDDSSVAKKFAKKYKGKVIRFNAEIASVQSVQGYDTRKDITFYLNQNDGPYFKFSNVGIGDTHADGKDTISVGDKWKIKCKIVKYDSTGGYLIVDPISMKYLG